MLGHSTINCATKGCYAIITVHPDDEARMRRTGETFYCPAGHHNYFPKGPSKTERERDQWKQTADNWREMAEEWRDALLALRDGVLVCPMGCGWHSKRRLPWRPDEQDIGRFFDRVYFDLREHLQRAHAAQSSVKQIPVKTGEAL